MLYYNKQWTMEMEAEEGYNKKETYKIPLTVFDVIRKNKMGENSQGESDIKPKDPSKKEAKTDFLFPLKGLFQ